MKITSSTFKQIMNAQTARNYLLKIYITFADGTSLADPLTETDIWADSFSISTASSSTSSFDIGSAVIGECQFSLNNHFGDFDNYDFFNATAIVWVGLEGDKTNNVQNYYRMGFFTVDEPVFTDNLIQLTLLDNMWKLDVPASEAGISFGAVTTARDIVSAICSYCDVTLATQEFHGYNFVLSEEPNGFDKMNCRELLQYVAMTGCNFCVIDDQGYLRLKWYNTSATGTDIVQFPRNFSCVVGTDEITITGIKFVIDNTEHQIGTDGYVLELENPLVTASNVNDVLNLIWDVLEGFTFRTFKVTTLTDLSAEVGDKCVLTNGKGDTYISYITNNAFGLNGHDAECDAVTQSRSLTKRYSKEVKSVIEEARQEAQDVVSDYDVTVQMMNNLAVNAMGAYQAYEDLPTGGRVYYLSNSPITTDSQGIKFVEHSTVFKVSGDGFYVAQDATTRPSTSTWVNGYNIQTGQLVVNVLNAIGINADWIKTGTIDADLIRAGVITDNAGYNYWDLDNNEFRLSTGTYVGSGSTTLNDLATKSNTIVDVDVEYAKNQSSTTAPTSGWSTSSPQWQEGYYIWQRTKTTDGNSQVSYSNPVCIQGAKGQDGTDGVGIDSVTITYGVSSSPNTQPSTWTSTLPTVADGQYLWTRTVTDYTDASMQDTVTYTYAKQGEQGQQGQAGTSVSVSSIQYQQGNSATTAPTGTWSNTPVTVAQGKYLWTKTTFSNGSIAYGVARQGVDGEDGEDGNGISSVTISYGTSTSASTQPSSWQSTIPTVPDGSYLWIRTITDYTDPNVSDTVTYTYSKQGKNGEQGQAGTSVTVSSIQYQQGTSATTPPTGTWSNTPVTVDQGKYLWTKTTFSNGSIAYGVARQGVNGTNGQDGQDGDDGVGVSAVVEQYYLSTSSSSPTGGSWSTNQPVWESGKYIWTRSAVTWTTGSTTYTTPVLAKAINGANSTADSANKIAKAQSGTCTTAAGTAAKVVTCANFTLFNGARISVIFTNANTVANPTMNVNSTGAKAIFVRSSAITATNYWSAGSIVDFVYDSSGNGGNGCWKMSAESQEEVYKRLTNNSQNEGIYLENGHLYLNASNIKTGNLNANFISGGRLVIGGADNSSGMLFVASQPETYTSGSVTAGNRAYFYLPQDYDNCQMTLEIQTSSSVSGVVGTCSIEGETTIEIYNGTNDLGLLWDYGVSGTYDFTIYAAYDLSYTFKVGDINTSMEYGGTEIDKGKIAGLNIEDGEIYTVGNRDLKLSNFTAKGTGHTTRDVYFFTPKGLYIKDSTFKIRVKYSRVSTTTLTSRTIYARLYSGSGTSWTQLEAQSGTYGESGSLTFDQNFSNTDETQYKIGLMLSGGTQTETFSYSILVPQTHSFSLSEEGFYGDAFGNFFGTATLDSADIASFSIEQAAITGTNENYTASKLAISYATGFTIEEDGNSRMNVSLSDINRRYGGTTYHPSWSTSDERVKNSIKPLSTDLSIALINGTETKRFKYNGAEGYHYGVLAQEARKLLDKLGETDAKLEHSMNLPTEETGIDDQRTIDYQEYIPHLINYVKDLRKELAEVKAELNKIKK